MFDNPFASDVISVLALLVACSTWLEILVMGRWYRETVRLQVEEMRVMLGNAASILASLKRLDDEPKD